MTHLWILLMVLTLPSVAFAQEEGAEGSGNDLQIGFSLNWDKVPFALVVFISVLLIQG